MICYEEKSAVPGRASGTYISTTIWEVKTEIPDDAFQRRVA
jgi:hypothetical protein